MIEKSHDVIMVTYYWQLGSTGSFASPDNKMPTPNFFRTSFMYRILTLFFVLSLAPIACAQNSTITAEQPPLNQGSSQEKSIEFSFDKADWKDVVPWFAEQAGFSWQSISEWPEGTFTLTDNQKYSPMEALDQLNYALRLRKPAYTIIRNRNQLILTEASSPLPAELIATVTPTELDQRGEYEIVRCKFSLGDIDISTIEADLRQSISPQYQKFAKSLPSTNQFYARETGGNLRKVRDTIFAMIASKATSLSNYTLKHYDPEQFLIISRRLLGIPEGGYERDDKSLVLSIDPSSDRFILKGTPKAIEEFKAIAAQIDVTPDEQETNTERPYLDSHPVFTDSEVAFKVIQTMLDGTDATVGQDQISGAIILRGRKEHHQRVKDSLATLRGDSGTTKIVQLEHSSASTILSAVRDLMNLSTASTEGPQQGPKMLANTVQNYIVIRGTPAEIFDVSQMITQLDQQQRLDPNRVRRPTRVIKMPPGKRDDLLESAPDLMRATGKRNPIRIIMPEDRNRSGRGFNRFGAPGSDTKALPQSAPAPHDGTSLVDPNGDVGPHRGPSQISAAATSALLNFALTSLVTYQPQDNGGSNSNSNQSDDSEPSSVPGSPIVIKGTAFGILIESDDLDALDDLEAILLSEAGEEGTDQGLTVFYLKYQKAASIKSVLDNMFGLGGSEGGAGGGDLLSGIVGNAVGEGAGDLLSGVLGGGGSSSPGAVVTLEGDVQIGMYTQLNLLYISGATQSDLNIIQDAIDTFDQPSPPQAPELAGQFYSIQVQHRDPEEVLERVQNLLADYIQSTEQPQQNQGNGGGNPEQAVKALRNLSGGNGNRQGGKGSQEEVPKVRLDLDKKTGKILLTGPEFIYLQVKELVENIDQPNVEKPQASRILPSGSAPEAILKALLEQFGGKLKMLDAADSANDGTKSNANQASGNQTSNAGQDQTDRERERADLIRNIRNQAQAGQRGGRGGGGRRGNGGGQRGGQRGGDQ